MTAVAGAAVAAAAAGGTGLLVSAWRIARPDPVRRGLGLLARPQRVGFVDRQLDRWDAWAGRLRQHRGLAVLGERRHDHRRRQLRFGVAAVATATLVGARLGGALPLLLLCAVALPAGLLLCEKDLDRRAARRRTLLAAQVLGVAENVALSVSAGESAAEAVGRAAGVAPEPIRGWLARLDAQVRSGRRLSDALADVTAALAVPEFSLLADTLVTATAHGAPLAATLVDQVADSRERQRALAMQRAGRAEIAMIVPIVLLVLPSVVIVAFFPGAVALSSL